MPFEQTPVSAALDAKLKLLAESHQRLLGEPLVGADVADAVALRQALWLAPRVIVAHGTEVDPVFFYGNRLALQLFEFEFSVFTRLPSRLSAEPQARSTRAHLMEKVAQQGFVTGYSGVRVSSSGRRFTIENATVWNLLDESGGLHGQAATFPSWTPLET